VLARWRERRAPTLTCGSGPRGVGRRGRQTEQERQLLASMLAGLPGANGVRTAEDDTDTSGDSDDSDDSDSAPSASEDDAAAAAVGQPTSRRRGSNKRLTHTAPGFTGDLALGICRSCQRRSPW